MLGFGGEKLRPQHWAVNLTLEHYLTRKKTITFKKFSSYVETADISISSCARVVFVDCEAAVI